MKHILTLILLWTGYLFAEPVVWVNRSDDYESFKTQVLQDDGAPAADYFGDQFAKRAIDQSLLLSKIDHWSKNNPTPQLLDAELKEIQIHATLSASNRLALFEYLKNRSQMDSVSFKYLCHVYANDSYLKSSEPFFDSSCSLTRFSLKDLNPTFLRFDILIVDGNKIDIQQNPYFYSSGTDHQFVFVSDQFITKEFRGPAKSLKQAAVSLDPWVAGECHQELQNNTSLSSPVKVFFSKDCVHTLSGAESNQPSFISRNKYYILSGLLIALAGAYLGSQYELGVTLP
jgi:hypothetical protein